MKHLLLTTVAAVLLVGCGPSVGIHEAAEAGNIEVVKQAIADGGDVNVKDKAKWIEPRSGFRVRRIGGTPLHYAADKGHKEIVELLIAEGADVNAKADDHDETPLHKAARYGHKEVAELLITKGAELNMKGGFFNETPLQFAVGSGHKEIVELLIAAGAEVNAKANKPLHQAAFFGEKEMVELLIAAGAEVNARDGIGKTALDMAKRKPETADLLRKHGGKTGAELSIHIAAKKGDIEAVKQHLAAGADVNAKDESGKTPLNRAMTTETAELLRKHGGKTAEELKAAESIHVAIELGIIEAVKQHLAAGTDVNVKDDQFGGTPLHRAAWQGHKEIVELLIAKGADVNAQRDDGGTPLDWAIEWGKTKTADLLRKHGGKTGEELKAEGK